MERLGNKNLEVRKVGFKQAANQTVPVMGLASKSTRVNEPRHTVTNCGSACMVTCVRPCASACQNFTSQG